MRAKPVYHFEWDAAKARSNLAKHRVSFRAAIAVFRDPLAMTLFDDEHSEQDEERWVSLGRVENGQTLVVVHTYEQVTATEIRIRVISARKADRYEVRDYENAPR